MKKLFLLKCLTLVYFSISNLMLLKGQIPQGINYQAVLRNSSGSILQNQSVTMKFVIHKTTPNGTTVYEELWSIATNNYGLVNLQIGQGAPSIGSFSTIQWGTSSHFLQVKANTGSGDVDLGTTQFLTVPYSMVADTVLHGGGSSGWNLNGNSGTVSGTSFIGTKDAQSLDFRTNNVLRMHISDKGQIETYNTGNSIFIGRASGANDDLNNRNNVFIGDSSGYSNSTGVHNVAVGYSSLKSSTSAFNNTAIGYLSLYSNTTGTTNSALGSFALNRNTTGSTNTAIGVNALGYNTSGDANIAVGFQSLLLNTSGSNNIAVGIQSLVSNINGTNNVSLGHGAMGANTNGNNNTAIGNIALNGLSTGSGNTALGFWAGYRGSNITSGTYNTLLGFNASSDNGSSTNCIVIAGNDNISLGGDNRVRIGNSSMSSIGGQVGWTTLSDERIKENITFDVKGLAFIMKLKPVTYNYSITKSNNIQGKTDTTEWKGKYDIEKTKFSGFLAQDVEKASVETGYYFSGVDKPDSSNGLWGLRYAEFTVPLVKAVQEQQLMIEELKKQLVILQNELEKLKSIK